VTLYETTIPVFIRAFGNLAALLEKARAYADEKGISHAEILESRLYEDMGNLIFQVQRCSDTAKFGAVRLAEVDNVAMEDGEKSFDDLLTRIAATVAFLKSVPAAAMDGREGAEVILKTASQSFTFTGTSYALHFVIPNFYFHLTTAYGLLRHKGVPVGKFDFLGRE
jgi:hypothetical protein